MADHYGPPGGGGGAGGCGGAGPTQIICNTQGSLDFTVADPPAEIVVEEENGEFKVFRITEKMVPEKVKEEMKFKLFEGKDFGEFLGWMTDLSDDELEAARQIYYDIWNFKSGDNNDKVRFELIEGEQKKRKASLSISGTTSITTRGFTIYNT